MLIHKTEKIQILASADIVHGKRLISPPKQGNSKVLSPIRDLCNGKERFHALTKNEELLKKKLLFICINYYSFIHKCNKYVDLDF